MDRTRLLTGLATVTAAVLAALPAVLVFGFGWFSLWHRGAAVGGVIPANTTPPEVWVLFALFYLVWMVGLMVLLVWTYDRLGRNWHSWDRPPRREKKRRRRLEAGLKYVEGQDEARSTGKKGGA
jgi:uncharacterized protein HemY